MVDDILATDIEIPGPLAKHAAMALLSEELPADFEQLKSVLRKVQR